MERRLQEQYRNWFLQEAEHLLQTLDNGGYKVALSAEEYCWGSNMSVLNRGNVLAVAYLLSDNRFYLDGARQQADYLLGVNAVDYSYVTGHGEKAYKHPHNRPTECDGIEDPMPGWVSGGPFKTPVDEPAVKMIPKGTAPMKCYVDHWGSYSTNEITIYWNSPAIFMTAYFMK